MWVVQTCHDALTQEISSAISYIQWPASGDNTSTCLLPNHSQPANVVLTQFPAWFCFFLFWFQATFFLHIKSPPHASAVVINCLRIRIRIRADSHYTSRFRSVAERHRSVKFFSCVIKWRCSHWQERLRHASVPFRRRCWARMFDVTERVRTCLYLLDSDNVNSLTSPPLYFRCLLATSAACFCLQNWMKN